MEGIVLRLLGDWGYKVVLLCNLGRLKDLIVRPL